MITQESFKNWMLKIGVISENDLKLGSKQSIINNLHKLLKKNNIEGRYHDEYWAGIKKLEKLLQEFGVDYELQDTPMYFKHIDSNTNLPNGKRYKYNINFTDNKGKTYQIPLIVTCNFVGKHGTMEDDVYELNYYFAH